MSAATPKKPKTSVKQSLTVNYGELQAELDNILAELQRDDLDVDAALQHYQRGLELVQQLEQYLKTAENKITELQARPNATQL